MKNTLLAIAMGVLMTLGAARAAAQGMAVNTSGAAANASAIFDAQSTSQGMLIPRMTNAQMNAISSPATGLLVYCSDCPGFQYYNGSSWTSLGGGSPTGSAGGDLASTYPNPTIAATSTAGQDIVTAINAYSTSPTFINVGNLGTTGGTMANRFLRGDNTWQNALQSLSSNVLTSGTTPFQDTIFHTTVINSTTTPSIFYTFNNACANCVLTNSTNAAAIPTYSKVVPNALYASSGTPSSSTYYRGDGSWQSISSGSTYALGGVEYFTQNKATYFSSITTDNSASSFSVGEVGFPVPKTGTLTAIAVSGMCTATYISGATNIVTFTIYQNGSATSTTGTLTFPNSATVNSRFSNVTTTSLAVTAGDILAIDISQSNYTNGAIGKTSVVLFFQ